MSSNPNSPRPKPPPINLLPHTVLADIFAITTVQIYYEDRLLRCLTSVCRLWREIVLSTPKFWRRVSFSGPVERLTTYLTRSQQASVDASIDLKKGMLGVEELNQSLDLLQGHWSYLRSLRVLTRDTGYAELILKALNNTIQAHSDCIMEEIYFNVGIRGDDDPDVDDGEDYPNIVPYLLLPTSQMLRSIKLRGFNLYPVHPHPATALLGLRELTLIRASKVFLSNGLCALLSLMPNLKGLWVVRFRQSDEDEEVPDVVNASATNSISLPNLESLSLVNIPGVVVNNLLRRLDMPNLRSFGFRIHFMLWAETETDWDALSRQCGLRSLSLQAALLVHTDPIASWFKKLVDLEKLEIHPDMFDGESECMKPVVVHLTQTGCCPKLKTLGLHFEPDTDIQESLDALQAARPSMRLEIYV